MDVFLAVLVVAAIIAGVIIVGKHFKKRKRPTKGNTKSYRAANRNSYTIKKNESKNPYDYYTLKNSGTYISKKSMTENEKEYWKQLQRLFGNEYIITPQVPLSSIVTKSNNMKYANELYRTIDFGLFTKTDYQLKALIEINDRTHYRSDRVERDKKVQEILREAGLGDKLVTLWTTERHDDAYVMIKINQVLYK